MTSNKKELIAINKALEVLQPKLETLRCHHILIQSDNTTAVYNINRKAAASALYLDLRHTLERAEKQNLKLTAVHIPGVENTTTDSLSRLELSGDY
jgi:ribonuclease HI